MTLNPVQSLTFAALLAGKSQATNNTASAGFDMANYVGVLAVRVNFGVKTVGDNDGTVTVILQTSATNNASNATNIGTSNGIFGSGTNVATSNNTAASGTIGVDTRELNSGHRYLFARIILAGTNSPAYPVAAEVIGTKQVQ